MIRITSGMTAADVLASIESINDRLANTQNILATGKQINQPSDDPYGTARSLDLRGNLAQTKQYETNVGEAQSWLTVTDTALGNISDLVNRARTLVVQAANGTLGQSDLQNISTELTQIIDSVKNEANAQYAGRYVFAGTSANQPYTTANDNYNGDANAVTREIGPGVKLQISTIGSNAIGDGTTGLLKALRDVVSDLNAGNQTGLQSTDLQQIDTAQNQLLNERAKVGAISNRLDTASNRLAQLEQVSTSQLSTTEDADMAKTMIDLSQEQAVYQAALRAGANLLQPSLMDFLH
ncbi:MAG: flagellar hook-associated protein FlgL [Actinobacteria bacterium]|nr:flagellar hook-associated protein FlgL [Actinomycetota bacterium]